LQLTSSIRRGLSQCQKPLSPSVRKVERRPVIGEPGRGGWPCRQSHCAPGTGHHCGHCGDAHDWPCTTAMFWAHASISRKKAWGPRMWANSWRNGDFPRRMPTTRLAMCIPSSREGCVYLAPQACRRFTNSVRTAGRNGLPRSGCAETMAVALKGSHPFAVGRLSQRGPDYAGHRLCRGRRRLHLRAR